MCLFITSRKLRAARKTAAGPGEREGERERSHRDKKETHPVGVAARARREEDKVVVATWDVRT